VKGCKNQQANDFGEHRGQDLPNGDRAQTDAGGGAGDRHERALGELAQRKVPARSAERDADRHLAKLATVRSSAATLSIP
jgi:hypothetical protein